MIICRYAYISYIQNFYWSRMLCQQKFLGLNKTRIQMLMISKNDYIPSLDLWSELKPAPYPVLSWVCALVISLAFQTPHTITSTTKFQTLCCAGLHTQLSLPINPYIFYNISGHSFLLQLHCPLSHIKLSLFLKPTNVEVSFLLSALAFFKSIFVMSKLCHRYLIQLD